MRIVTWNINGLRAVCKRGFGDLATILRSVKADIVCFQETKLTKAELDRDLALVEGWDSYFSHCKDRSYSGVATYCRKTVTVPVAAEQGITGFLHQGKAEVDGSAQQIPSCFEELCNRFTQQELLAIDLEGRCVITDHGAFILFNLYGPAITSEENAAERFAYKMRLYQALQCRMEACLAAGRAVILVGDLNICPQPIDSCDPGDVGRFGDRADKKWLSAVMKHNGGYFVDLFRHFYPTREEVYSCWSTASSARVNNYGARIDFILLAEPAAAAAAQPIGNEADAHEHHSCDVAIPVAGAAGLVHARASATGEASSSLLEQCTNCDVWMDMQGSDHAPVWADWTLSTPLPTPEVAPPLSSRYMFTGKQRKLTAWLGSITDENQTQSRLDASSQPPLVDPNSTHQTHAPTVTNDRAASQCTTTEPSLNAAEAVSSAAPSAFPRAFSSFTRRGSGSKGSNKASQTSLRSFLQQAPVAAAALTTPVQQSLAGQNPSLLPNLSQSSSTVVSDAAQPGVRAPVSPLINVTHAATAQKSMWLKAEAAADTTQVSEAHVNSSQDAASTKPQDTLQRRSSNTELKTQEQQAGTQSGATPGLGQNDVGFTSAVPSEVDASSQSGSAPDADKAAVTAAWSRIQSQMKAPKCKGHGEDCVIREVKKSGPNKGRLFYVCRRPDGKPPQGRCDHFEWVGNRTTRGQSNTSTSVPSLNKRLRQA